MAENIIRDSKLWLDGYDLSGDMNALAVNYGATLVENTALGDHTVSRLGGAKTVSVAHEGYWNDTPDSALFAKLGVSGVPMTLSPETGAEGELAYFMRAVLGEYAPGGSVGEMFAFSVSGESDGDLVRGTVMHNASQTVSGVGTARQLGAAADGQSIYAAVHVLSASGSTPTLAVTIESAADAGFTTPTTRLTFDPATAIGSQWASPVAGPVTDTWWRVSYTLGGTTPEFQFVVVVGIQ